MSESSGRAILLVSFIIAIGFITYQEIHDGGIVPRPSRYVASGVVYGVLGFAAPFISYPLAAAFGVGMIVALGYKYYNQKSISNVSTTQDEGTVNV